MKKQVYERVFANQGGKKGISLPLSDKIRNKIISFFSDSDSVDRIVGTVGWDVQKPAGLAEYEDSVKEDIKVIVNEVINSEFSEYFYPIKWVGIGFAAKDLNAPRFNSLDNYTLDAIFYVTSKVKGASEKLDELSDILDTKF